MWFFLPSSQTLGGLSVFLQGFRRLDGGPLFLRHGRKPLIAPELLHGVAGVLQKALELLFRERGAAHQCRPVVPQVDELVILSQIAAAFLPQRLLGPGEIVPGPASRPGVGVGVLGVFIILHANQSQLEPHSGRRHGVGPAGHPEIVQGVALLRLLMSDGGIRPQLQNFVPGLLFIGGVPRDDQIFFRFHPRRGRGLRLRRQGRDCQGQRQHHRQQYRSQSFHRAPAFFHIFRLAEAGKLTAAGPSHPCRNVLRSLLRILSCIFTILF